MIKFGYFHYERLESHVLVHGLHIMYGLFYPTFLNDSIPRMCK
jgi:hypothetical protein